VLVRNLDLMPEEHEPSTFTDTQGTFRFPDSKLAAADSNGDGIVDWRDGMVVVGRYGDNGVGTLISVIDSISGSDMGFPLVGLPGQNATLLTTLKYASLLRWRPGLNVAGIEVTPGLINALYGSIVKDVPATFFDDGFSEYVALGSDDPALVALGTAQLRFNYAQLVNVLTVIELFRQSGLDFSNEAAWGYLPDPSRQDPLEIVAFAAYGYALATRFGESPLDYQGRPAVAAQFDGKDPAHVRAMLAEILAAYPTERLLTLAPEITADFVVDAVRTPEQHARIEAAIERHLGGFLDNLTDGVVLAQQTVERRINDSVALSDLVPQAGQQLFVPSIAGAKRLFVDVLARELVALAPLPDHEFRGEFYPLFFAPKLIDSPDRVTNGSIGLSIEGADPTSPAAITLSPASAGRVRLRLDLFDSLGALAAPDAGLAVRFRLGGTARGTGDYTLSTGDLVNIATFPPGSTSTTIDVEVSPEAIRDGSRFLQIEILSADSGFRVDGGAAVATIAFGPAGRAAAGSVTGNRSDFVPHALVTREAGSDGLIRAGAGGDRVVLRGIEGEADLFVVGETQALGVPFIENIDPDEGDGIVVFVGDILAARRADRLADPARRDAALASIRSSLGGGVVDRLAADVLADLIDARIEELDPLPAFAASQINTYGGIVFDVIGRRPLAYVSSYSTTTGDSAWSTMSTSIAAGIFRFGDLTLSTTTMPETVAAGTVVGELANSMRIGQGDSTFSFAAGQGDDDNSLFEIVRDESGFFPRSFLVARGPFDYESDPRLSVRVRATGADGSAFERIFVIDVVDLPEQRIVEVPPAETVVFPGPLWSRDTLVVRGGGRVILDSPNAHSGGVLVEGGEVVVRDKAALGSGPLEVGDAAGLVFEIGGDVVGLSRLGLSETARVDVGFARLVISAGGYEASHLQGWIRSARNGGAWDGPGITSGEILATSSRAIGHRILADGSVIVGFAAVGDATMDGRVDIQDLIALNSGGAYGTGRTDAAWWQSDFNADGRVDVFDLLAIVSSGLYGAGSYLPPSGRMTAPVRELPTGAGLTAAPAAPPRLDSFTWAALASQAEADQAPTRKTNRFRLLGQG